MKFTGVAGEKLDLQTKGGQEELCSMAPMTMFSGKPSEDSTLRPETSLSLSAFIPDVGQWGNSFQDKTSPQN